MFKRAAVFVVSCGALLAGCGTDAQGENEEIISNLQEAGFPAGDIQVVDGAVYVGGDAHVTLAASRERLQRGAGSAEQYRHSNLVNTSIVRKICVNPSSAFKSYTRLSQGLDMALANYNSLGLTFTMVRGPATGCNANINVSTTAGTGHTAGFPSNGYPYGQIAIGIGLANYTVDLIEHVVTHALGHTIGFIHSDYYNRSISCGTGGAEAYPGLGPIHIPGTPTTATPGGSLMDACPPANTNGGVTSTDITALNYLY